MSIDITTLFVCLDDFCKMYEMSIEAKALPTERQRNRGGLLSLSEMLLIEIMYHLSPFKDFKHYYLYFICHKHRDKFRVLPTYQRFVALKKQLTIPLIILQHCLFGEETGIYFADSSSLRVCHNKRISRHKVFANIAERGMTTMGWFYGLKLHLIINNKGEIISVKITPGNANDGITLKQLARDLKGKCFADKGYVGKDLFESLWHRGLHLITGIRKNMKNKLMPMI